MSTSVVRLVPSIARPERLPHSTSGPLVAVGSVCDSMPCLSPIRASQNRESASVRFHDPPEFDTEWRRVELPCGRCIGCRRRHAQDWTLRCTLESFQHGASSWVTLTYDPAHCPVSVSREHLSGYLKRLRQRLRSRVVRFFGSGEYGDTTKRPHYHVILYGVEQGEPEAAQAWPFGYVRHDPLSPAAIAYVAGYVSKKYGSDREQDIIDPETGEVHTRAPAFLQMSRRPGIGGDARRFSSSWRSVAVLPGGGRQAVPRYLHESWLQRATDEQVLALKAEREAQAMERSQVVGWRDAARARLVTALEHKHSRSLL
ncbi:replication initiator protein [Apis mellifera associated microvirus 12]|nr:replication initiator protein [Apis mellifera associated microvirus 12]